MLLFVIFYLHIFVLLVGFCSFCIFYAAGFFLKQNKEKNCLVSLIYYTTDVYSLQLPYQKLTFTKFSTNLFTRLIYFRLCAPILSARISSYSWSSVKIPSYSWSRVRISSYLWPSVRVSSFLWEYFLKPSYLWKFLLIYGHLWELLSTFFCFLQSLWK